MATTTSTNGAGTASAARSAAAKVKDGGETVARRTPGPVKAAGLAAAGLAGGLALGASMAPKRRVLGFSRRKVLGLPIGRRPAVAVAASALVKSTRRVAGAGKKASDTAEDIHEIREHLEQANRQSPIEVLLSGLTHRRGAHRAEN